MIKIGKPTQRQIDKAAEIIYEQTKKDGWYSWSTAVHKRTLGHPGAEHHVSKCIGIALMILRGDRA